MPASTRLAGCQVASYYAAHAGAMADMACNIAPGGSMLYIGGLGCAHHVNAVVTPGNRVCRTGDMERAATVAANHRFGMVTISVPAMGAYEVHVVQA